MRKEKIRVGSLESKVTTPVQPSVRLPRCKTPDWRDAIPLSPPVFSPSLSYFPAFSSLTLLSMSLFISRKETIQRHSRIKTPMAMIYIYMCGI